MSFNVGIPIMKIAITPSTQTKGGKNNTCAINKAWDEANDFRHGKDKDINHEKTHENEWIVGSTDMNIMQFYQNKIADVDDKNGGRKTRKDAVVGITNIFKPPVEIVNTWDEKTKEKFFKDSRRVFDEVVSEEFTYSEKETDNKKPKSNGKYKRNWQRIASVIHNDEGSCHEHDFYIATVTNVDTQKETFNNKIGCGLQLFGSINREYPKRMRELGWDIADCKCYEDLTEEEKKEASKKPKGLTSTQYKNMKEREVANITIKADKKVESILQQKNEELNNKYEDTKKDYDAKLLVAKTEYNQEMSKMKTELNNVKASLTENIETLNTVKRNMEEINKINSNLTANSITRDVKYANVVDKGIQVYDAFIEKKYGKNGNVNGLKIIEEPEKFPKNLTLFLANIISIIKEFFKALENLIEAGADDGEKGGYRDILQVKNKTSLDLEKMRTLQKQADKLHDENKKIIDRQIKKNNDERK